MPFLLRQYPRHVDRPVHAMVSIPRYALVERVYQLEDYGKLKLATPLMF